MTPQMGGLGCKRLGAWALVFSFFPATTQRLDSKIVAVINETFVQRDSMDIGLRRASALRLQNMLSVLATTNLLLFQTNGVWSQAEASIKLYFSSIPRHKRFNEGCSTNAFVRQLSHSYAGTRRKQPAVTQRSSSLGRCYCALHRCAPSLQINACMCTANSRRTIDNPCVSQKPEYHCLVKHESALCNAARSAPASSITHTLILDPQFLNQQKASLRVRRQSAHVPFPQLTNATNRTNFVSNVLTGPAADFRV